MIKVSILTSEGNDVRYRRLGLSSKGPLGFRLGKLGFVSSEDTRQ